MKIFGTILTLTFLLVTGTAKADFESLQQKIAASQGAEVGKMSAQEFQAKLKENRARRKAQEEKEIALRKARREAEIKRIQNAAEEASVTGNKAPRTKEEILKDLLQKGLAKGTLIPSSQMCANK